MKSFLAVICAMLGVAGSLAAQPANAQAEKVNNIRKLITLTGGAKILDQMFNAMAANFKDPEQQQAFQEFRKEFDPNQIYDIMVPAYDKYLSGDDVKEILRFYESPTGQKLLDSQPKIMADSMPKIMQWSQQVTARVMEKMKRKDPH